MSITLEQAQNRIKKLKNMEAMLGQLSAEKQEELETLLSVVEELAESKVEEEEKQQKETLQMFEKNLKEDAAEYKKEICLGIEVEGNEQLVMKIASAIHRSLLYDIAFSLDRQSQLSWKLRQEAEDGNIAIAGSPYENQSSMLLEAIDRTLALTQPLSVAYASLYEEAKDHWLTNGGDPSTQWIPTLVSWGEIVRQRARSKEQKMEEYRNKRDSGQAQHNNWNGLLMSQLNKTRV